MHRSSRPAETSRPASPRAAAARRSRRPPVLTALLVAAAVALSVVVVLAPWLPDATDIYVHVLWPWQVMRCLDAGVLPVWLPDLNAGFGSPGIRLYSPLTPFAAGLAGLLLGTAARGARLVVLAAFAASALVARRTHGAIAALLIAAAPAIWVEAFGRFPMGQLLALPVSLALLSEAVRDRVTWRSGGVLLALLWLLHAPSLLMVAPLAAAAAVLSGDRRRTVPQLGAAFMLAAGLTAFHWLGLVTEGGHFGMRDKLTQGEFLAARNLLALETSHLPGINAQMGWAAVGILAAVAVTRSWGSRAGALAVAVVTLVSPLAQPVWRHVSLLDWLQFPWRLLYPASLLAAMAVASASRRRAAGVALMLLPWLAVPWPAMVREPALTVAMDWREAGARVAEAFGGNPFIVDVVEHRPPAQAFLADSLVELQGRRVMVVGGVGEVRRWEPLTREVTVATRQGGVAVLRLLEDRRWHATVDDEVVPVDRRHAAVAVQVPPGEHVVRVEWREDPSVLLAALAAAALLLLTVASAARDRRAARASAGGETG